jgi:hypothetical protein
MKFMDLLFKRYADPFPLLTGYIQTSRMCEFIDMIIEQKVQDDRWEFYLHKVWDKSYGEFCEGLQTTQDLQQMDVDSMEATIERSMKILGNFTPDQGEGET